MRKMGLFFPVLVAGLFAFALFPGVGHGELKEASKYRKVTNNVGNCIFSTGVLEFKKEDAYKDIRTEFKMPEEVHARCYFPKPLGEYQGQGKMYNSLKRNLMYSTLQVLNHAGGEHKRFIIEFKLKPQDVAKEQSRFDLVLNAKECDWKYPDDYKECVDIKKELLEAAAKLGQSPPYTGQACISETFRYVDQRVWSGTAWKDDVRHGLIAETCFKYTVTGK